MNNVRKRIARNIKNQLGLNAVAGAGGGGKGKSSAGGNVYLKPPESSDIFQSISYISNLDLVCEGPIDGPVKQNGERALGIDVLESVFYNETPIKSPSVSEYITKPIKYSDTQAVDRFTAVEASDAIDNIISNLNAVEGVPGQSGNYSETINSINQYREEFLLLVDKNKSFFNHFGFIQFDTKNIFGSGDLYLRDESEFSINLSLGEEKRGFERNIQAENGTIIQSPGEVFFTTPSFLTGSPSGAPANKVGDFYPTSGFHGGGFIFFYIGDNLSTGVGGEFLTGKFIVPYNDPNIEDKLQSGIDNNYDVLIHSGDDICFGNLANQTSPSKGSIIGEQLNVSVKTSEDSQFNYLNASIDYTIGTEYQLKLLNHSKCFIQANINQQLFGRFRRFGGDARDGDGNTDTRASRLYANWQNNLPQDSDAYGYTHIIKNNQISKATPTIMISSLSDTEEAGDDIGKTLREFVEFEVTQGFEGDEIPLSDEFFLNVINKSFLAAELTPFKVGLNGSNEPIISEFLNINESLLSPNFFTEVDNGNISDGSGIYLKDQTNTLQNIDRNSVLTNFGFTAEDVGALFFNVRNVIVVDSGKDYTGIETDLFPQIKNFSVAQAADFDTALSLSGSGSIVRSASNFDGGLYRGIYELGEDFFLSSPFQIQTDGPNVDKTTESRLETSLIEGIPPKQIYLAEQTKKEEFRFEGVISSPYLAELNVVNLPQNRELRNATVSDIENMTPALAAQYGLDINEALFPNDEWKNINRYIKVFKKTYETESILISRDVSLAYITEEIDQNFTYPFSALFGSVIDARSFNQAPDRTFELRLKKCLVPSNYQPLFANGMDKRFVFDSSKYGLREVYKFNDASYFRCPNEVKLGQNNYEISFKIKLPDTTNETQYLIDTPNTLRIYIDSSGILRFVCNSGQIVSVDISSYNNETLEIVCRRRGNFSSISIKDSSGTELTDSISGTLTNEDIDSNDLYFGAASDGSSKLKDDGKITDVKIKINNQLRHYWDGTIIQTPRGKAFRDKFGGNHALLIGAYGETEEDSVFEFGKNKEQVYIGEWDGSFKLAWTDNPAWILYDIMTNHTNGLGDYLDDMEDIDIFHLYELGRYCDAVDEDGYFEGVPDSTKGLEPRFSANFILQEQKNAFEVIAEIASLFRAMTYWNGGFFNFTMDKPKGVQAIFNNANVFDGVFNYADIVSSARYTSVEVPYLDKNDNYKIKIEYVEDEDKMRKYGKRTNKQSGFGLTSKSQARRMAKYILFSNQFETEAISFVAGSEASLLSPGDIIQIEDEIKNFEINYGRILNINTGQGYLDLEQSFKTGSVVTGENGGLYTYNNKEQTDVKSLYDMINFNHVVEVGPDGDLYSGVPALSQIDSIDEEQVTKFYITGIETGANFNRVFLDQNQESYNDITGIIKGAFFNVELENRSSDFFKVIKISEEDSNKYNVNALEYRLDKFDYIEQEDYDLTENEYNVGIPNHTINRPPAPVGFTSFVEENQFGSYDVTGTISGELGGNELKYRVSLIYPNGKYSTHEFLKDTTTSPPKTNYSISNLSVAGNYDINVTSLRNPESSISLKESFQIQRPAKIRDHFLIKSVNINGEHTNNYSPEGLTGSGFIIPQTKDYVFKLSLEDMRGKDMAHNIFTKPILDIYIDGDIYKENYGTNTFRFSHENNINLFGYPKRDLDIEFKLKDENGQIHHTAKIQVNNPAPIISKADFNPPRINFEISEDSKKDLKKVDVYKSVGSGTSQQFLKTELVFEGKDYIDLFDFSEEDVFSLVPFDDYGSGNALGGISYESPEPTEQEEEELSKSFKTVYICKGSGESITQDSNGKTGIFCNENNSYVIKGSFSYSETGDYATEFYIGGNKAFSVTGFSEQLNKTVSFMEFVFDQTGYQQFSLINSGANLKSFFFEVDETI